MPTTIHSNLIQPDAIHQAAFVQTTDPGAVGANKFWVNTTGSAPYTLRKRNAANTGWDVIGSTGAGTVTSVGLAVPADKAVSGSPVTGSGTITITDNTQSPNLFKAGPTSGAAATPSYRAIVPADLPVFVASGASHARGAVPDPGSTAATTHYLREDATWQIPPSASVMVASGASHAAGLVPDPGATAATTHYLREDATWQIPPSASDMVASGASHAHGLAPDPGAVAGTTKFLREDATWAVPAGGGGGGTTGAMVPIQTQNPVSISALTFNVPSGYKSLRITGIARSDNASSTVTASLRFNGDTGTNYFNQVFQASGTTGGGADGNATATSSIPIGVVNAASAPSGYASSIYAEIPSCSETSFNKNVISRGTDRYGTSSGNLEIRWAAGHWNSAATITSITILLSGGSYVAGSSFTLWGESDAAPALLTTNSNLISEIILNAAVASINVPNIAQGYKIAKIELITRGDTAAQNATVSMQFNSDTGANYNYQNLRGSGSAAAGTASTTQTSGGIGFATAASATANIWTSFIVTLPDYSRSAFGFKTWLAHSEGWGGSGSMENDVTTGYWASQNAITSALFLISAGNFVAGTVIRVYGEPASMGGPSVGTGTKARISANQSVTNAVATLIDFDTDDVDADNQHYVSNANLTGTVAKTAASATLTGTSTLFTTELSIGQVIMVPGTANEKRVVIAIASATSLTVNAPFANTNSGQTATRVRTAFVFRQPGFYEVEGSVYSAAIATGNATLEIVLNDTTSIKQRDQVGINANAGYEVVLLRNFQQWDFVELRWTQGSSGAVNVLADERTHLSISSKPTVIVAIPYINIQDQKANNTSGGTFTSGAWQTRDLNTIASDTAGIASISLNQFTLSPGTYRIHAEVPAYGVNAHKARLQNITDSATQLLGTSQMDPSPDGGCGHSIISGKFVITATKSFSIQHQCQTTRSGAGFGTATNFGVTEIYTNVELWKEG